MRSTSTPTSRNASLTREESRVIFFVLTCFTMYWMVILQLQRAEANAYYFCILAAVITWWVLKFKYGIVAVVVFLVLLYRTFFGQFFYPIPLREPRIQTIVYTFPDSPRFPYMEMWLYETDIVYEVEYGYKWKGTETVEEIFNLINVTVPASIPVIDPNDSVKRLGAILKYWDIIRHHGGDDDEWLLLLEDDAEPLHIDFFTRVHSLSENESADLVFLDNRNAVSWISSSLLGGVCGILLRRSAAPVLADWLYDGILLNHYMNDERMGKGCGAGVYKCSVEPLLKEGNFGTFFNT